MKLEELTALKPGTEVYILYGCNSTDDNGANRYIEKCIFDGLFKYSDRALMGLQALLVGVQANGCRGLWYLDRTFLTKEDAEIARISFLLGGKV